MSSDTYSSIWLSHSSVNDYLSCPRAYYLKNIYRNPSTNRKISLAHPNMSLGSALHEVLESLKDFPVESRFAEPLVAKFERCWTKYGGRIGGFTDKREEDQLKLRGMEMLNRVEKHPGPLLNKATKKLSTIMNNTPDGLPSYWLSEEEGIVLCGNIDWMEYIPEDDSIHLIDFKTGKSEEKAGSLQLPIYALIAQNCQGRKVTKASYWYIGKNDTATEVSVGDLEKTKQELLDWGRDIKMRKEKRMFNCSSGGCFACTPYEEILEGKAEYVGVGQYGKDIFIQPSKVIETIEEDILVEVPA